MRCFRPLSQLSNSTLSHDRVEQCLTKKLFYNNIYRCIIVAAEEYDSPIQVPKACVFPITLRRNPTLSRTKIRIIFQNTKFYSPHLSFPPNICPNTLREIPMPIITYQNISILEYSLLSVINRACIVPRLKLCDKLSCVELSQIWVATIVIQLWLSSCSR